MIDFAIISLTGLIFLVAILYSSVGHGGASGYLGILSFFAFVPDEMATTALLLNVLVAGVAFIAYFRAGHFSWPLTWPFIVASVPAAFLGGLVKLPPNIYYLILSLVLLYAAYRLIQSRSLLSNSKNSVQILPALAAGGGIGVVSGMIGVGGGIFLSPLILLMHWADAKHTTATSAMFIVVNALAGLAGRYAREGLIVGDLFPLLIAGFVGGLIGSHFGSRQFSNRVLQSVLAGVLVIAAINKLIKLWGLMF